MTDDDPQTAYYGPFFITSLTMTFAQSFGMLTSASIKFLLNGLPKKQAMVT